MQHGNKYLSLFLKDFVSFLSNLSTPSQMDAWKKLKLPKLVKDASNLASFYSLDIDGMVCMRQIVLGSARK